MTITTQDLVHAQHATGGIAFRFNQLTAENVADDSFSDGRNELPGGRGVALYRTETGCYVWEHRSQWQGEPGTSYVAATNADGSPVCDDDELVGFVTRYGSQSDVDQLVEDLGLAVPIV